MSNKKNGDDSPKYIIDRIKKRPKKHGEAKTQKSKRQPMKRSVDDSTTLGLGCWFFLILPFIGTILVLIILIGLTQG
ncbi:hypothetical protein [Lacicoccus qingdaonensis]|uniref:hypothetical protein n=1 Tax=Lacicoccus qingdaonensis TaxID=576118 RepID=UPI000B854689|nr:hypothetical protein [Salinicoccus qingdaonensis]